MEAMKNHFCQNVPLMLRLHALCCRDRNSRRLICLFLLRIEPWKWMVKFIYSEKATKFLKISTLLLTGTTWDKSKVEISQNFVAFSEYMNFTHVPLIFFLKLSPNAYLGDNFANTLLFSVFTKGMSVRQSWEVFTYVWHMKIFILGLIYKERVCTTF